MADEMEAPDDVHSMHPSLAQLGGTITQAKQGLDDAKTEKNYTQKRVKTAKNLLSEDLSTFKNKGEKMFKVLYDGIGLYEDKELQNETFSIMLEKDSIIPGTYIDNKTVLFGDPYNVYCSAINVEPTDITHSEYKDNKHEYDQTVIINVTDFDQLQAEKMFKVLYDGIGLYEDKELQNETFSVMLEKDSIISGTYIDNKTVLFGDPYNVYCSAINVEPTDITHSENKNNKHEYDQTVIINVTDFDQLQAENKDNKHEYDQVENHDEDVNGSSDYVVVDDKDNDINKSSAATSEFETINASDAQDSHENDNDNDNIQTHETVISVMQVPPPVPTVPPTPPTPPAQINNYNLEQDEDEDIDESSALLGNNSNNVSGMPPPPTSPSQSFKQNKYAYQNANNNTNVNMNVPPPVPSDAVMVNDNYIQPQEEMKSRGHVQNIGDRMSMDDIKLADDINNEYSGIVPSTGNILEDLDNLLRIYRNLIDDKERELVYKEFWSKYDKICRDKPWLLLNIPTRVRGFLGIMNGEGVVEKMEPYKRDKIMMHVLSRNGLLEEPAYIRNRYLYTYFIQFEIFNYFKWFFNNCGGVQSWMFFWLWLLMFSEIIHIGIDFGRGNPWRAILMECLVPLTFIASIQFVNTPFTSNILRPLMENKCAALCTVYGRVSLNILIIFFCLGSIEISDIFTLFAAFMCGLWTIVLFICFNRLEHSANYVRIATGRVEKLKEKFMIANESKDGILTHLQLRQFFKSYNQIVPLWQIDLMISQYDVHRDNGLRFDALKIWFEKIPINHLTRMNLLSTQSGFDLNNYIDVNTGGMTTTGINVNGPNSYPMTTSGQMVMQSNQQEPQYTEAEKEWLGLAGKKYMNK